MISSQTSGPDTQFIYLTQLAAYSSFGAWLQTIRNRRSGLKQDRLTQEQVVKESVRYSRARHCSTIDRRAYGSVERDGRTPLFDELEPLFLTYAVWFRLDITDVECKLYVYLAKQRISAKQKKREEVTEKQWNDLEQALLVYTGSKRSYIQLVGKEGVTSSPLEIGHEALDSRRMKAIEQAIGTDTSHLLEREEWASEMLTMLATTPQKKLVIIQGAIGTGKTHALTLLIQRISEQINNQYVIPFSFESGTEKTPEDHLDVFLATAYADIMLTTVDETQRPLIERINQLLVAIKTRTEQGQRVVFILDNVQEMFPSVSGWSLNWKLFFETLIRESHTATMYLATRTWPGYPVSVFVEETELPEMSVAGSITIWQRYGYTDVAIPLLEKICQRYGRNPQMIEMLAYQNKQRKFTFGWQSNSPVVLTRKRKNANEERLETLLSQDVAFDIKTDRQARAVLQQAVTGNLSHQARVMLECLAVSPLGLPLSLLDLEFPRAYEAYGDLINASLVDLNAASSHRAMIVPLVREAQIQTLLTDARKEGIEARITDLYAYWLTTLQDFRDDSEKAGLIAEMVVRYIRQQQYIKAAELFIGYGWLCSLFGHVSRIERVFNETVKMYREEGENTEHEVGRLLLRHRIAVAIGQKFSRAERDQIYQNIHRQILEDVVKLPPHAELEVLHNMLLYYNGKGQFQEAKSMFDQTLVHLQRFETMKPEVFALFLFDKARLLSYCADKAYDVEASLQYTRASIECIRECITNWRLCLKNALPLQEIYFQYKLARALNDMACDLRTLKQFQEAQIAIEESIQLKKLSKALPHSIAVALSEYSQILAEQGEIQKALSVNDEAKKLLEQSIVEGDDIHNPELGLILKERANIFLLQARLLEAKSLLESAIELIGDKPLRQREKAKAKAQIDEIQHIVNSSQPYKLDRRWFSRFADLVDFNDIKWLTQAGPFTEEESIEWEKKESQEDEQSQDRMSQLIARSRKREFTRSLGEKCEPIMLYPYLPLNDVRSRMSGLTALYQEVDMQEPNMVVHRLYLAAINEHLTFLRLCEAIVLRDKTATMHYNLQLYGKPSEHEFKIALQQLCTLLLKARTHSLAAPIALDALSQLREWGLSPQEILAEDLFTPTFIPLSEQVDRKLLKSEKRMFSTAVICTFFRDVLKMYGEDDWNVSVSSARDHTSVDPNIRELILPEKTFSVYKVRQLLAEEIEIHAYRAIAGRNSSLALLGSGLANHLATDEGLAYHYVQSVNGRVYGKYEEKRWNATLTTGFVSGVLTHELSFPELRGFLEKMFLVDKLLDNDQWEDALEFARQAAWRRCCRVFRGAGCLSLKDRVYLQGYLEVSEYLAQGGKEHLLYVGCIGISHLEDMAELNIIAPNHPHQHLATAPDLAERLALYERNASI